MGYIFSPDYGATWSDPEIAINAPAGSLPYGIVADENWGHIMAEPGVYVRRRLPPVFSSIRREGQMVILEWRGQGILQSSGDASGPWEDRPPGNIPRTPTSPFRYRRVVEKDARQPPADPMVEGGHFHHRRRTSGPIVTGACAAKRAQANTPAVAQCNFFRNAFIHFRPERA